MRWHLLHWRPTRKSFHYMTSPIPNLNMHNMVYQCSAYGIIKYIPTKSLAASPRSNFYLVAPQASQAEWYFSVTDERTMRFLELDCLFPTNWDHCILQFISGRIMLIPLHCGLSRSLDWMCSQKFKRTIVVESCPHTNSFERDQHRTFDKISAKEDVGSLAWSQHGLQMGSVVQVTISTRLILHSHVLSGKL